MDSRALLVEFFFFNDTATTEIYTLSLHDALPISGEGHHHLHQHLERTQEGRRQGPDHRVVQHGRRHLAVGVGQRECPDRKSTRLNSSHANISYAVFCLKKKNITTTA